MPYDAVSKPSPAPSPILDRFRSLLRDRDTDFIVSNGGDDIAVSIPPPSTAEIVRFYKDVLSELTFNSKPIITDLTIIAGEHREHCEGIADLICSRVLEVSVEQKLPSLYLLDSIVKNIGREYANHFAARLPEVFCETYRQVPPNLHHSMRHLFGTWWSVFPSSVLRHIEDELQFSPKMNQPNSTLASMRASESPHPSHGIHVNPKYLEARRQFDNPSSITSNVQLARGASDPKTAYDDFESGMGEVVPSNVGPQRAFEKTYTSIPEYSYGRKMRGRDDDISLYHKRLRSDDSYRGFDNVASYNFDNSGRSNDRPRALIDAYGHDDGHRHLDNKPLGMDSRVVANGVGRKTASQSWKNIEEEEFDWEDMSPTLVHSRTKSDDRNETNQITEQHHHSLKSWKSSPKQDVPITVRDNYGALTNISSRLISSGFSSESTTPSTSVTSTSTGLWPLYQHQQYRTPVVNPMQLQQPSFTPLLNPSRPIMPPQVPPQIMRPPPVGLSYTPLNHGVGASGSITTSNLMNNNVNSSFPFQNVANGGFVRMQAPVRPHPPLRILPIPVSSGSVVSQLPPAGVSGLISSLVSQGVLSLAKQSPVQEPIGVEFDADLLKLRHESSIRALYDDLPRQCTTCGLRFKAQEEHSKHMDWHVTKNRISKNRKQNLSRKWFVSATMWLSGAESLGTDAAPGFLPTETAPEKDDEEMAVLADENQTTCALCGEAFEDFYSDENEEWMYRGAVYLNVPDDGSVIAGVDVSQLGPIVHAKCRSDSSAAYS